jgi:hypothetical protein
MPCERCDRVAYDDMTWLVAVQSTKDGVVIGLLPNATPTPVAVAVAVALPDPEPELIPFGVALHTLSAAPVDQGPAVECGAAQGLVAMATQTLPAKSSADHDHDHDGGHNPNLDREAQQQNLSTAAAQLRKRKSTQTRDGEYRPRKYRYFSAARQSKHSKSQKEKQRRTEINTQVASLLQSPHCVVFHPMISDLLVCCAVSGAAKAAVCGR